jgi:peptide/nickel transport system substrate-binding protein
LEVVRSATAWATPPTVVLGLALAAAGGCGGGRCEERPGEFRIALAALPNTLDWSRGHETNWVNYPVLQAVMRGLVAVDGRNEVIPDLAVSWEVRTLPGPAGKPEYTFHLERGTLWSDGETPLTARDFVVGLRRALLGAQASELADLDGAAAVIGALEAGDPAKAAALLPGVGVEAVDDVTLRIRLVAPRSYFLARIAGLYTWYPAPARELEGRSAEEIARYFDEPSNGRPLVLGAYRVAAWDRLAQVIRLERNPFSSRPAVDRLTLLTSPLAELLYERGKIAFLFFDDPAALGRPPADLQRQELLSTYWLGVNAEKVPLPLRQAIAHAIDRPRLLRGLLPNGRPAFGFLPDALPGSVHEGDPRAARFPRYDPALARALVARSGYDGRELTLLVRATQSFLPERGVADALRRQLAEVGIRIRYDLSRDFVTDLKGPDGATRPELFLRRIGADFAHPATFFSMFEARGNHFTALQRADPATFAALQALVERGAAEGDPERSRTLYAEAQELLLARAAVLVPLFYPDRYYRRAPGVEGLRVDAFNFLTFAELRGAGEGACRSR